MSPILGKPYVNRYVILRDAKGNPVGVLYAGISLAQINAAVDRSTRTVAVVAAAGALVLLGLVVLSLRSLRRDARRMVDAATRLASGDIDVDLGITSNEELGMIGRPLAAMIA